MAFGGYVRTCIRFDTFPVKKGQGKGIPALRCVKYSRRKGRPVCSPLKVGGGRSRGLLNKLSCRMPRRHKKGGR